MFIKSLFTIFSFKIQLTIENNYYFCSEFILFLYYDFFSWALQISKYVSNMYVFNIDLHRYIQIQDLVTKQWQGILIYLCK